jgi:sigma-E factor negative regulatory protein RseA
LSRSFAARVNGAIDGEPASTAAAPVQARTVRWWRPIAGAAVAAGVAAVAVVALQQRAVSPAIRPAQPLAAQNQRPAPPAEPAGAYVVPPSAPAVLPARLTSYVFAHSKYSSFLGQSHLISDLLAEDNEEAAPASAVSGEAVNRAAVGVAAPQTQRDAPIAP